MYFSVVMVGVFLVTRVEGVAFSADTPQEPQCLSRFDYDYKVLQKLVLLEQGLQELRGVVGEHKETLHHVTTAYKADIAALKQSVDDLLSSVSLGGTVSTYVRWGRSSCPAHNGTTKVYDGFAGGSHQTHRGAAANYLCLPSDPLWDKYDDTFANKAFVFGAEYEIPASAGNKYFDRDMFNDDVPCVICQTVRSSVMMVPGRNACYEGWTLEYSGYLAAGYYDHAASTEYVCLDGQPESLLGGGDSDTDGKLFYMAEAHCGSLKCPPYVHGREMTCAVCSK